MVRVEQTLVCVPLRSNYIYRHLICLLQVFNRCSLHWRAAEKAYEVKKNYIWQRRKLCSPCNAELYKLKTKNLALQERWTKEKTSLQRDPAFIAEWLAVIDQFPTFGSRIGSSMGKRLKKLQASVPNPFQMTINIDPPCVKWSTDTSLAILTQDT